MAGKNTIFILLGLSFFLNQKAEAINCPPGWKSFAGNTKCQPAKPSSDYFYDTTDTSYNRAVCGLPTGTYSRIPVLPNFEPLQISTRTLPNSSLNYTSSTYASVPTTRSKSDPNDSTYLYNSLTRCACIGSPATIPSVSGAPSNIDDTDKFSGGNFPDGFARIYPDTYDVISTQNQSATVKYNMVAYADSSSVDGRIGENFRDGISKCGCPNLNEEPKINGSTASGGVVGVHCEPIISSPVGRVLTTYNPAFHDGIPPGIGQQIASPSNESVNPSASPARQIILPTAMGGSQLYTRKIWTCAPPYKMNAGFNSCVLQSWTDHACNDGGGNAALASPVSQSISPNNDPVARFNNTINKKLACCLNDYGSGSSGAFIKFDCIENANKTYADFNALWQGTDNDIASGAGGQSNAIVLAGPLGKYLTGFYTLDGVRCDEFSEFSGAYRPMIVKKSTGAGTGSLSGWSAQSVSGGVEISPPPSMNGLFPSKTVPTSPDQMRRCPILARAAIVVTCPQNPELPVVQKTYKDTTVSPAVTRCTAASSVQVHVRIEQIFEIEGQPKMKPIDTIAEKRLASSLSVEKIIANKTGAGCPGGTSKLGDVCAYQ